MAKGVIMLKKYWKIPDDFFSGEEIYIIGGGPSIAGCDFGKIKDKYIIAVNNAYGDMVRRNDGKRCYYKPRDWVDVLFFGDLRWYEWHSESLKDFRGTIVTSIPDILPDERIHYLHMERPHTGELIKERTGRIRWNSSSGAAAINLAVLLGARSIILLGFDMKGSGGIHNYHNDHLRAGCDEAYVNMITPFEIIARSAQKLGVVIINGSEESAITAFPRMHVNVNSELPTQNSER